MSSTTTSGRNLTAARRFHRVHDLDAGGGPSSAASPSHHGVVVGEHERASSAIPRAWIAVISARTSASGRWRADGLRWRSIVLLGAPAECWAHERLGLGLRLAGGSGLASVHAGEREQREAGREGD
jgi:hypothetical protein